MKPIPKPSYKWLKIPQETIDYLDKLDIVPVYDNNIKPVIYVN